MNFWRRYRTIVLGTVAMLMLLYSAVYTFDVEWPVMLKLLGACLLLCLAMAVLAAAAVAVLALLKRLLRRFGGD